MTLCLKLSIPPTPLIVVSSAKPHASLGFSTDAALNIAFWRWVHLSVLGLTHHNLKIFNAIISAVMVPVVHHLCFKERPSEVFGHNKAVLENVSALPGVGVVAFENNNITSLGDGHERRVS